MIIRQLDFRDVGRHARKCGGVMGWLENKGENQDNREGQPEHATPQWQRSAQYAGCILQHSHLLSHGKIDALIQAIRSPDRRIDLDQRLVRSSRPLPPGLAKALFTRCQTLSSHLNQVLASTLIPPDVPGRQDPENWPNGARGACVSTLSKQSDEMGRDLQGR